jgi:hypothetical protein
MLSDGHDISRRRATSRRSPASTRLTTERTARGAQPRDCAARRGAVCRDRRGTTGVRRRRDDPASQPRIHNSRRRPQAAPSAVTVNPLAIQSAAQVGAPALHPSITVSPTLISSTVQIGAPVLTAGTITSSELVREPSLTAGPVTLSPSVIPSASSVGEPTVTSGTALAPVLIASTSAVADPIPTAGAITVISQAIPGQTAIGYPSLRSDPPPPSNIRCSPPDW